MQTSYLEATLTGKVVVIIIHGRCKMSVVLPRPQSLYAALIERSVARAETSFVWDRVLRGSGTVRRGWENSAA